jgi:hypothetical protein
MSHLRWGKIKLLAWGMNRENWKKDLKGFFEVPKLERKQEEASALWAELITQLLRRDS